MSSMKTQRLTRLVLICSTLFLGACFNPPRWVYSVPPRAVPAESEPDLTGFWHRKVSRRFPIGRSDYLWKGREWIAIPENGTYKKFHVYVESVEGRLRKILYKETGKIQVRGRWVLFQVESALLSDTKKLKANSKSKVKQAEQLFIPGFTQVKNWKKVNVKALLYHLDDASDALVPASFERFGTVYEHGIHEGAREPYDNTSHEFQKVLNVYLNKKPQPHAYYRDEKQDPEIFN